MHRRCSYCLCHKTRCIVYLSPAIVPYIFEVVNVTTYIWLYTWILMYRTAALEIPISRCILCVSICLCSCIACMDVMSSRRAVLLFWSRCKFRRVVSSSFCSLQKNSMLLLLRMCAVSLKSPPLFFFFVLCSRMKLVYKVQVLSIAWYLIITFYLVRLLLLTVFVLFKTAIQSK